MTHSVLVTGAPGFISSAVAVNLLDFVAALECEAIQHPESMQPGDVKVTEADEVGLHALMAMRGIDAYCTS